MAAEPNPDSPETWPMLRVLLYASGALLVAIGLVVRGSGLSRSLPTVDSPVWGLLWFLVEWGLWILGGALVLRALFWSASLRPTR